MTLRNDATADEIRMFYAGDMERRVKARVDGNRRIDMATNFLLTRIKPTSKVLDIGCGIGIASERMAQKAKDGHVWAIDISPAHIDYCQQTIQRDNMSFRLVDIIAEFENVADWVDGKVDMITLVDVIEHLPQEVALQLFMRLPEILTPNGRILMTYPSPEYQRKLYNTPGARLQAIDRVVELDEILMLAEESACKLRAFNYVDIWQNNQYIHCELVAVIDTERAEATTPLSEQSLEQTLISGVHAARTGLRKIAKPLNTYKYIIAPRKNKE